MFLLKKVKYYEKQMLEFLSFYIVNNTYNQDSSTAKNMKEIPALTNNIANRFGKQSQI